MSCILIIDDDAAVREATAILLRARGYDVKTAEEGGAGIEIIKQGGIDLAIVDVFMPGMDGLTATDAIHRHRPNLPIIAVSGFMFGGACPTMPAFDDMAAEAGAIATLYKPLRPAALISAIEKAMNVAA